MAKFKKAFSSPFVALYVGKGADRLAACERKVWLLQAISKNDIYTTRMLLAQGTDLKHSHLILHAMNNFCNTQMLEFLLRFCSGFDINSIYSGYGIPLFHTAVLREDVETMKVLIKYGADVNSKDVFGSTPLHKALPYLSEKVVSFLLDKGADINAQNDCGELPLHKIWCCQLHGGAASVVFKHIVKLQTANMYLDKMNSIDLSEDAEEHQEIELFRMVCQKEILEIKQYKIGDSQFTYYNILSDSANKLANYSLNVEIAKTIGTLEYRRKFPIYATLIENNYRMGVERCRLLQKSLRKFNFLFKDLPQLPTDCVEKIFSYLSNGDLKIFIGYSTKNVVHWSSLANVLVNYYPPGFTRTCPCRGFLKAVRQRFWKIANRVGEVFSCC